VSPNTIRQADVAVVGAGPTGVTVATLLAQYGVDCVVLDRWADVYPQPRAVHMDDEICRIMGRLGIAEEFLAISRPARGLRLLDPARRTLAEFRRDDTCGVHGYPQANMFDQPELEALLRRNLKRFPKAELIGNAEVTDISQTVDGRHRVSFTDRTDGSEHGMDATYILGCDGANSIVRAAIGSAMTDLKFEQRWLVVDVATDADLGQWDGVHQVCDPNRAGTYMRIGPTRYRWEFRLLPGETADDFASMPRLLPLIAPWTSGRDRELELLRVTEYTFRAQIADHWRRGNIFLLGDAAHLTPPFIGQGMGAGLRDAMNLAWKLAGVLTGDLPAGCLDSYQRERKPHTRSMIRLALAVGWSMTAGGRFGDLIRRVLVTRAQLVPGLRTKIIDSRTPPLHGSAYVHRSRGRRSPAGTLCPNAMLPDGRRLDDTLGDGFAFVTATPLDSAQRRGVAARGAQPVVAEGELADWLRRGRVTVALVRPDRTVMSAGRDVTKLADAIPRFSPHGRIPTNA
jgi:3-(3-hydroxy-phenyl)propionate hydroxylase